MILLIPMGSMVSDRHCDKVMSYITNGSEDGARVASGGSSIECAGLFIPPTVVTDIKPDMDISKDKSGGPVLGIVPVSGNSEAMSVAKDTDYGLYATVFTTDIDRAIYLSGSLACGTVSVNGLSE